jgi:hypothetical protein
MYCLYVEFACNINVCILFSKIYCIYIVFYVYTYLYKLLKFQESTILERKALTQISIGHGNMIWQNSDTIKVHGEKALFRNAERWG